MLETYCLPYIIYENNIQQAEKKLENVKGLLKILKA